jgi:hypothetical protein
MPAPVLVVALRCTVTASTLAALVDVVSCVSRLAIVDDAFTDRGCLVPLRCGLGMNRGLFLLLGGLRRLFLGQPAVPRGGTLGLLHSRSLEETSNLIAGPTGLGVDSSGILRRSMAAVMTFWLARLKTGGSPA